MTMSVITKTRRDHGNDDVALPIINLCSKLDNVFILFDLGMGQPMMSVVVFVLVMTQRPDGNRP